MTAQELKNSVLRRAFRGELVERRAEEGTGAELLKQIEAEKAALTKAGKLKKEKPLPPITEEEKPFEIPEHWTWTRLGNIVSVLGGKRIPAGRTLTTEDTGYKYIRISDMKNGTVLTDSLLNVPQDIYPLISKYIINKEDVYITVAGTIGRVGKIPPELDGANLTENADRLVFTSLNQDWLIACLESEVVQAQILEATTKVGQPKLAIKRIQSFMIPLPPLAEQARIVAKLKEIWPEIERYAAARDELEALNRRFPNDLRKAVLQSAIRGELVERRGDEGTGAELLKQIEAEKASLTKAGKLKKEKPLPTITDEEKPFEIPEHWTWTRLGECSTYSQRKEKIAADSIPADIWSLDLEDIEKGSGKILRKCHASERKIAGDKVCFDKGQILYSKLRPYLKKVLVAPDNGICSSEIVPFNTYADINPRYLVYVLTSPYADNVINAASYGIKMPRVSTETMTNLLIPLPPLAEQARIVAKLEEILPLCDRLR